MEDAMDSQADLSSMSSARESTTGFTWQHRSPSAAKLCLMLADLLSMESTDRGIRVISWDPVYSYLCLALCLRSFRACSLELADLVTSNLVQNSLATVATPFWFRTPCSNFHMLASINDKRAARLSAMPVIATLNNSCQARVALTKKPLHVLASTLQLSVLQMTLRLQHQHQAKS